MEGAWAAGRAFLLRDGRLLERRLLAARYEGGGADAVAVVLRGYRNSDGGFGHGLEPDVRTAASQPLATELALRTCREAAVSEPELAWAAATFLGTVADAAGDGAGVPLILPSSEGSPRAEHWGAWGYRPDLNPTAGLVGELRRLGVRHPWVERAAGWCWERIDRGGLPPDAHAFSEVLHLLASDPDRERVGALAPQLAEHVHRLRLFHFRAGADGYGLTPLHLAPDPAGPWRSLFPDPVVAEHLDHLARSQQGDGGWPIAWTPPGPTAVLEWRGIETVRALGVLAAYGRLHPGGGG